MIPPHQRDPDSNSTGSNGTGPSQHHTRTDAARSHYGCSAEDGVRKMPDLTQCPTPCSVRVLPLATTGMEVFEWWLVVGFLVHANVEAHGRSKTRGTLRGCILFPAAVSP